MITPVTLENQCDAAQPTLSPAIGKLFILVLFGHFLESKFGVILHSERKMVFSYTDAVARKSVNVYDRKIAFSSARCVFINPCQVRQIFSKHCIRVCA